MFLKCRNSLVLAALWFVCVTCQDCSLWLAPSYLGTEKEPKYGLIAGKSFDANETLPLADLAIPLIDMVESYNRKTTQQDAILDFWEAHLWAAEFAGATWEGLQSALLAIPGIGMLPQYHSGISNVDFYQEGALLREKPKSPKSGTPHPSRGGITPYHNVTLKTSREVPAGMELFADFGGRWDANYTNDIYQDRLHRRDYEYADQVVEALVQMYDDLPDTSLELQEDILDFVLRTVLGVAAKKHAKAIRSLIPTQPHRLRQVLEAGGTFLYRNDDMIRSIDWLSRHGYCLDILRSGPSKIAHAGRGAFMTRDVRKGEIITVSPMLHLPDKSLLTMYPLKSFQDPTTSQILWDYDLSSGPIGQQLLLNYCFGHPESSLLLFPMASHVGLINHDWESANANLAWARVKDNGLANQHKYQDYTVDQLVAIDRPVFVLKVVAQRDILEGEEVTLNYGLEWDNAWNNYMERWERVRAGQPHPWKAEDVKAYYKRRPLQTQHTIAEQPYPPNVATACFLHTRERPEGFAMQDGSLRINEWYEPEYLHTRFQGNRLYIVDVLERYETGDDWFFNYTVLARYSATEFQHVVNVPHDSCTFVNRPYTSDIHLDGAFRHPIQIPDAIFPQKWRDLR